MPKLFESTKINSMVLANRFVRSATWEALATDDGSCTPQLIEMMEDLVEGGVRLIITSHAHVRREGRASRNQLGIYDDKLIPGLRRMTEGVHKRGGRIVMQINHLGLFARPERIGQLPLGPSVWGEATRPPSRSPGREMTVGEIEDTVQAFGQAARRARAAGFDGVQVFTAHGFLISQFLSPAFNQRTDAYGGALQGRARILWETLKAVRESVGGDYPILVKWNSEDFLKGGLTVDESLVLASMLRTAGVDAIELSGGTWVSGDKIPSRKRILSEDKEAYFRETATLFRAKTDLPLMLVGGIRSFEVAEKIVGDGIAEYVSLCRPLIREPGLVRRWQSGNHAKSTCISCNQCLERPLAGEGVVRCFAEEKSGKGN